MGRTVQYPAHEGKGDDFPEDYDMGGKGYSEWMSKGFAGLPLPPPPAPWGMPGMWNTLPYPPYGQVSWGAGGNHGHDRMFEEHEEKRDRPRRHEPAQHYEAP